MNIKPYQSFEDERESNTITHTMWASNFDSENYKLHEYAFMRKRIGEELLDFLYRFKSPCVIDIIEDRKRKILFGTEGEEITISVRVTNVVHRNAEVRVLLPMMDFRSEGSGFMDRVKALLRMEK